MNNYTEFREPFLGGGSMSIAMTRKYPHLDIWVNDLYVPLFLFWKTLQQSGEKLVQELFRIKRENNSIQSAKDSFVYHKKVVGDCNFSEFDRAVSFFVVNKCSFSGLTESSSFSSQASVKNFTESGIENLISCASLIEKWKITNVSYEELLSNSNEAFVYLDPPYDIKISLYGKNGLMHKHFNHDKFAEDCDLSVVDMMISYNVNNVVRGRFSKNSWKIEEFEHTYTMRSVGSYMESQKKRNELIVINYSLK